MVLSPESLAANITGEGPLISVGPLMDHDIVRLGELSVTKLADESLLWSRGSGLGGVRVIGVHWVTLTMAMMEAGVKLVVTKPLLEQEGLAEARGERGKGEAEVVRRRGGGGAGGGGGGGRDQRGHGGHLGASVQVERRVLISLGEHGGVN